MHGTSSEMVYGVGYDIVHGFVLDIMYTDMAEAHQRPFHGASMCFTAPRCI